MRETGPIRKGLAGDETTNAAYIAQGRTFLGILKNRMKLGNLSQLAQTITLPNGTVFQVSSIFGHDTVRVTTPRLGSTPEGNPEQFAPTPRVKIPPPARNPKRQPSGTRTFAICNGDIPNFFIDIDGEIFPAPFDEEVRPVIIDGIEYSVADNKAHVMPQPYGPVPLGEVNSIKYFALYIMVGVVDPSQDVLVTEQPATITVKDTDGNTLTGLQVVSSQTLQKTYGKVVPVGLAMVTNPVALAAKDIVFSGVCADAPASPALGTLKVQQSLVLVATNNDSLLVTAGIQSATINGQNCLDLPDNDFSWVQIENTCASELTYSVFDVGFGWNPGVNISTRQINDPSTSQVETEGYTYDSAVEFTWTQTSGNITLAPFADITTGAIALLGPTPYETGSGTFTYEAQGIVTATDVIGNVVTIAVNLSRTFNLNV